MPQFGRPSNDQTIGTYTDQAGGVTNIWQTIDESSPDDGDFIRSVLAPSSAAYVTKFTTVEDPQSSSGHVFRNRYSKDAAGGAQIDMVFQLRMTYVNEGSLGTLIVARTFTNISEAWTTDAYTLSGGEADAITDYANLYNRVLSTQV